MMAGFPSSLKLKSDIKVKTLYHNIHVRQKNKKDNKILIVELSHAKHAQRSTMGKEMW